MTEWKRQRPESPPPRSERHSRLRLKFPGWRQRPDPESLARALEESRKRYYELFEFAPVGYLGLSADGEILEANAAAASLLGTPKEDLIGSPLSAFMSAEDAHLFHEHRSQLVTQGGQLSCELDLDPEGGPPIPVLMEGSSIENDDHEVRCRCVLIDLSELRQTQAKLHESERRLRDIAARIDAVLYIHDDRGTISYVNPAYERIWGQSSERLYKKGAAWLDAVHSDDADRVRRAFADLLAGGTFDQEYRVVRPNEAVRWVWDRASPTSTSADGAPLQIAGLVYDITERRQAEAELRHAQKMEAIGTLASGIAHDFNNVLQAILGSASAASGPNVCPDRRDAYLRRIRAIAKRGGTLAQRLLVFSRDHEPDLAPIQIDEVVAASAEILRRLAGEHIELILTIGAPDGVVLADALELEQILLNLVANARDAMPAGGALTIRTEIAELNAKQAEAHHPLAEAGEYVRLSVEDTGVGMNDATRRRIFEPFFTTKEAGKGTGLGLSTVFAIMKRSGGHIDVKSRVSEGTKVSLCFPRCEQPTAPIAKEPLLRGRLRGTALLVEDDLDIRATLRANLEELGLQVFAADGFEEALKIRDRGAPLDVVITDVLMPRMPGPALVKQIRDAYPKVRVLYMSADSRSDLVDKGMLNPEDEHIQKPFDRGDLGLRLQRLLQGVVRAERLSPSTIVVVEDNQSARLALRDLLEDLGYRVLAFANPTEAIDAVDESPEPISLLLTDVCLAEMEGDELASRLRVAHRDLPVVFMSGLAEPPELEGSLFLKKPIDIDELTDAIETALR